MANLNTDLQNKLNIFIRDYWQQEVMKEGEK